MDQSLELTMLDVLDSLEELSCDVSLNHSAYPVDIIAVEQVADSSNQPIPFPLSAIH